MKDYYEILGLEEDASSEEIRERWLELSKIYHPDVLKSPEADERIKEINEAYQVLKDYSSRLEYDLQRALQKSVLKKYAEKEKERFPWQKVYLPAGILAALVFIVFFIFFKIPPPQDQPVKMPVPEAAKTPKVALPEKSEMVAKVVPPHVPAHPPTSAPPPEPKPKKTEPQEQPKLMAKFAPKEEVKAITLQKKLEPQKTEPTKPTEKKPEWVKVLIKEEEKEHEKAKIDEFKKIEAPVKSEKVAELEKPKEIEKPLLADTAKVVPPQVLQAPGPKQIEKPEIIEEKPPVVNKTPPPETMPMQIPQLPQVPEPGKIEKPEKLEREKEPEKPVEMPEGKKPEPVKVILPEPPQIIEAKKPEKIEIPEKITPRREEEVQKFLDGYIAKYRQKDLNGFLSYFSTRAIQNQKYKLTDLKKIYTNFFDQSLELNYHLKDVQTSDHPQGWEVRAKYELSQVSKKDGTQKSWRGQIRWILIKENGQLKIISLDYQHQK